MSIVNDLRLIPNFLKVDSSGSAVFSGSLVITNGITGSISATNTLVSSSTQLTSSFDGRYVQTGSFNSFTASNTNTSLNAATSSYELKGSGIWSGSSQLPSGIISGSSQILNGSTIHSASFFNGISVVSGSSQITYANISSIPSGIVSGSSQITPLLPTGVVSGSSQITYTNVSSIPAGIVSGSSQITLSSTTGGSTSSNVQFNSLGIGMAASATAGRIDASGDIVAYSTSDRRFKENITPIPNAIEKITKISGNTYDWKGENKDIHGFEGNDVGVIAQEIESVLPQLVTTRENGYKAVKYDKLVALLIEGIKEQQIKIDNLTIVVENLKKQKGL